MGWYTMHRDKGMTNRTFFEQEYPSLEFLEDATVNGVFYAACRNHNDPKGEVFAMVNIIQWVPRDYYNFSYKPLDEFMGPYSYKAPVKVLDLLSPTGDEIAIEWRFKCREYQAKRAEARKVKKGDTVVFAEPMRFTNGDVRDSFTFESRNKFRTLHGTQRYTITGWRDRKFSVNPVDNSQKIA